MRILLKYIFHLITAKSKHGVHSPFVYELMTEVWKENSGTHSGLKDIEAYRKKLKKDHRLISYKELGAGSRKTNKSNNRKVSEIVKSSSKSPKQARMLHNMAAKFGYKNIIELGTSFGISTLYLACGSPEGTVHTIEGNGLLIKEAQQQAKLMGLDNIIFHEGNIDILLPKLLKELKEVDLVFFDGNHRKEPTWNYFTSCLNKKHEGTVFIFDDIYWSKEMEEVWQMIKNHPEVSLSIDTFDLGFVFFQENREKEHFKIRI